MCVGSRNIVYPNLRNPNPPSPPHPQSVMVKEQLNVLMIGFREVVRQVSVQCTDRGMLLDKIWKAMSGLLDFVVKEMQDTIIACEGRMADLNLRASR